MTVGEMVDGTEVGGSIGVGAPVADELPPDGARLGSFDGVDTPPPACANTVAGQVTALARAIESALATTANFTIATRSDRGATARVTET
jgi:hypothetical protein